MDEQLIRTLSELGLTNYEARVYLALTRRGSSTAAETQRVAGIPRQRIYDVLASLVTRGLAATRPGQVTKYVAMPPADAIERLVSDHRQRLERLERESVVLAEALAPAFDEAQAHTDPLDYIEVLRDRGAINQRFGELQAAIEREILVFTKPPYATPPEENVEGLEVTRTHEVYSVYELSVFDDPENVEGVRRFVEAGEQARFVEALPLKLVIIDERIVLFGMEDPVAAGPALTMLVVEHPSLASVLKIAFMHVWESGLAFEEARRLRAGTAPAPA
ncbi:MAG TPA: helix-turn-helix domain-containing protein [Gaiellaceae bacterium]|nr:helix-turn-helix domain-containing protein [Gaiellaceae bacterium]